MVVRQVGKTDIYSSLVFRQQDAPNYIPGILAVIAPAAVTVFLAIITSFVLRRENWLADKGEKVIDRKMHGFRHTI